MLPEPDEEQTEFLLGVLRRYELTADLDNSILASLAAHMVRVVIDQVLSLAHMRERHKHGCCEREKRSN